MTNSISLGAGPAAIAPQYDTPPSPEQIREHLVKMGILPTHEEAKTAFWSLGSDWWKQIIDGKYHEYGPMVFDQGLHGEEVEPGYLANIGVASHYITDHFHLPLSVKLYTKLHHLACSHFALAPNNGIICASYQIDWFRTEPESCNIPSASKKVLAQRDIYITAVRIGGHLCSHLYPQHKVCFWYPEVENGNLPTITELTNEAI